MKDNLTTFNLNESVDSNQSISTKVWKHRYTEINDKLKAILKGLGYKNIEDYINNTSVEQFECVGENITEIMEGGYEWYDEEDL